MAEFKRAEHIDFSNSEYDLSMLSEYMDSIEEAGGEAELAIIGECGVVKIESEEGEAVFSYPEPLAEGAEEDLAVSFVFDYCLDNEIIPAFIDVPLAKLPVVLSGVISASVEGDGEYFSVRVNTPPMLLDYPPETCSEGVYLSGIDYDFAEEYKRLIMDFQHNRYTGYDIRCQMQEENAEFFVDEAEAEFRRGVSITLAASILSGDKNVFIGEGVLYRFDGKGECEISFRILPEYCGRGYSAGLISALIQIAGNMGLSSLVARVRCDNLPGVGAVSKFMTEAAEEGGIKTFCLDL